MNTRCWSMYHMLEHADNARAHHWTEEQHGRRSFDRAKIAANTAFKHTHVYITYLIEEKKNDTHNVIVYVTA